MTRLRNLLHYSNTKLWDNLTEGGDSWFFAKDLKKHPRIYNYVMKELQDYIAYVQQIYPKLEHVKGGAILSAPNSLLLTPSYPALGFHTVTAQATYYLENSRTNTSNLRRNLVRKSHLLPSKCNLKQLNT